MDTMKTQLDKIWFHADSPTSPASWGFQELSPNGKLLHLYDADGDQLDSGNGYFPNASWRFEQTLGTMDTDSPNFENNFWQMVNGTEAK
jgi:hypothetical protein